MLVFGILLFFFKKKKEEFDMLFIEYFEYWKDIVVFFKGFEFYIMFNNLLILVYEIKLCYVVNLYSKLEELDGEYVFDFLDKKYRENLFCEWLEKFKVIGNLFLGYFKVLVEVLKIFSY